MNALAPITFTSAYRQLRPAEKTFVDNYVTDVENKAAAANERISNALSRPVAPDVVARADGMLDKPMVRAAIAERITEIAAASELTTHRVIKELRAIAFSSLGDYMEVGEDGMPYFGFTKCTPEQLSAIASIEMEELPRGGRKMKFKLHDKIAGITNLMRYMGLLDPDNPHWKADNAKTVEGVPAIHADASDEDAGNEYARMINGQ